MLSLMRVNRRGINQMVSGKDMENSFKRRMDIIEQYIFNLDEEPEQSQDEFEAIKNKLVEEFGMVWDDMPKGIKKE